MLPAIMLAAYRGHYAECIVFTAHLIASCLYHACAEEVYSVCLISVSVLSWSDSFTTILTIWVTIVTMARHRWKQDFWNQQLTLSLFHFSGCHLGNPCHFAYIWKMPFAKIQSNL